MIERVVGAERGRAGALLLAPEVTSTRAPRCLQICSAASATPPPMPQMRTVSPARTCALVTAIRHAVSVARVNAAATSSLTPSGIRRTFVAGSTTSSASVPGWCSPRRPKRRQSECSPVRQYSHWRQLMPGLMSTRSPGRTPVTSGLVSATVPMPSAPRIQGGVMVTPGRPPRVQTSRRLSAAARRRTRTPPDGGSTGGATSSR